MVTVTMLTRPALPFTAADLERMPDDGYRYELIDGSLIVTPAPTWLHQSVVVKMTLLLSAGCPEDLRVLVAPMDVRLTADTVMEPDLVVARNVDLGKRDLPAAPVLAVEVLSPSTRRIDLTLKHSRLEAAGCPSYWVVDPGIPSVTAWELRDGRYALVAEVSGSGEFVTDRPYPVSLRPADLVR